MRKLALLTLIGANNVRASCLCAVCLRCAQVFERILSAPIPWKNLEESGVVLSDEATDLIKKLLVRPPTRLPVP